MAKRQPEPSAVAPLHAAGHAQRLLRRLEWQVIRKLDGVLQGDYRTLLRGAGIDLADLREYEPHDDVRRIDWNVTARTATPHVRVFTEDREMAAWFVLDLSPSTGFGSGRRTKREVCTEFVGVLARLLTRHGNRVGALIHDGVDGEGSGIDARVPARSGRPHVLHLLHTVLHRPAARGRSATRLAALLRGAGASIARRSTVFVVSDFLSDPGWDRPLGMLARRHDVVAVRLYDPLELDLPDLGLVTLRDAETGEHMLVDTHDRGFRRRFAAAAAAREAALREGLARAGVDTLELCTDDDLGETLLRFADLRRHRVRPGQTAQLAAA
ncbi:DUF58 domain-containing protein [Xylophilus sp.]|uniref:DUF58 domain-containing protein n=1 Tax=Xylophilus sp. TaxID=2653893 RepID=UPI0013B66743|nr:DUF58 domain-containing protein [Xylophilus sp.]KAF1043127.1 MAG: hypothetical protein GAK38_04081 [Xylophilus sp.]